LSLLVCFALVLARPYGVEFPFLLHLFLSFQQQRGRNVLLRGTGSRAGFFRNCSWGEFGKIDYTECQESTALWKLMRSRYETYDEVQTSVRVSTTIIKKSKIQRDLSLVFIFDRVLRYIVQFVNDTGKYFR
jgi:hypothetical protein